MAALTSGKIAEVFFEEALETIEDQIMLSNMCETFEPASGDLQNAGNIIWRPVEQQAVIQEGWDLTGQETGIIEETYPAILGLPQNDLVSIRADDMRDMAFWRRRGRRSGRQQIVEQNTQIANAMKIQGSLFYENNTTSGYNFVAGAQALMNEQQRAKTERCFILNDRSTLKFAEDLAGRQTLQGRPADTWDSGQIGSNIAEFDIYTASFLPALTGGADPDTTVTGNQSFAPQGGTVNTATGIVTNVDYRTATIPVAASGTYNVGDKVIFVNGGVTNVNAIGISDKINTNLPRTFTIVDKPNATSVTIYPKPIAADDAALSTLEKAYANVDTTITNGSNMRRQNLVASSKTNLFYDKDAIEVFSGQIPANLFAEYDGFKVLNETMPNGQEMYMIYDANMINMQFRYRLFTWYGITIKDPQRVGVAIATA